MQNVTNMTKNMDSAKCDKMGMAFGVFRLMPTSRKIITFNGYFC